MKKSTFTNILKESLNKETLEHNEYLHIVEVMKPFEGELFNKRLQNKLPENMVIKSDVNGYSMHINGRTHFLAYYKDARYSAEIFAERNAPYNRGAKDRAEKIEKILNTETEFLRFYEHYKKILKLAKLFKEIKMFNSPSYYNPSHANILKECLSQIKDERTNKEITSLLY